MSATTTIEWTDRTWNPTRGCSLQSDECRECYAMKQAHRFSAPGKAYHGLTMLGPKGPTWTGEVREVHEALSEPLRWREPAHVFVDSMSDLFHPGVSDAFIDRVFAVMHVARRHTFQVLTKQADRMLTYLSDPSRPAAIDRQLLEFVAGELDVSSVTLQQGDRIKGWPLPNVWIGVSAGRQKFADDRVPKLLQAPAAVRFVSCEPLLDHVDLGLTSAICTCCQHFASRWVRVLRPLRPDFPMCLLPEKRGLVVAPGVYRAGSNKHGALHVTTPSGDLGLRPDEFEALPALDLVIAGGESSPRARPPHPDWFRSLRNQCVDAGVAFFFKQWGSWQNGSRSDWSGEIVLANGHHAPTPEALSADDRARWVELRPVMMAKVGKKAAGRLLDGCEWNELPRR